MVPRTSGTVHADERGIIGAEKDYLNALYNSNGAVLRGIMKREIIARPLANFLNRVSIDREVKQNLLVILERSKFAHEITAFANDLGYVFSESDLHDALGAILSPQSNAYEADLSDDALDAVVGGAGLMAFPADLRAAFGELQFGASLSDS
jgi:hypothetical protein